MNTPLPERRHCACEFEGDTCVVQCKLHGAHINAIHEWAERAKKAEARTASLLEALQEIVAVGGRINANPRTWLTKSRAAIAKATGGAA